MVMLVLALAFLAPAVLHAQMSEVSDEELSSISAQAGINANYGDFGVNITTDSIRYSDTDTGSWIELNNFAISGPGGYFLLDCPVDYPMTVDVGSGPTTDGYTRTLVQYQLSDHINPRTWTVGNLVFCNQDLGSLTFDTSTVEPSIYRVASHLDAGTSGIDFEYLTKWRTQDFTYAYSTAATGNTLQLTGLNLAETVTGDPTSDPATWVYNGTFRIGDIVGGNIDVDDDASNAALPNPATIDIATDTSTTPTNTSVYLNLPMKGSIRVANVNLGGTDFGPIAIDGITAHRFGVRFNPGN